MPLVTPTWQPAPSPFGGHGELQEGTLGSLFSPLSSYFPQSTPQATKFLPTMSIPAARIRTTTWLIFFCELYCWDCHTTRVRAHQSSPGLLREISCLQRDLTTASKTHVIVPYPSLLGPQLPDSFHSSTPVRLPDTIQDTQLHFKFR